MTLAQGSDPSRDPWGLFPKGTEQLHDLPMRFRWEFSRRHPYYLTHWQAARHYQLAGPSQDIASSALGAFALAMIRLIAVTGTPVDPQLSFSQLDEESPDPAFLAGAIQPMTYRALVTHLIGALSPAAMAVIGSVLQTAAHRDYAVNGDSPNQDWQRAKALGHLNRIHDQVLDSYFDGPLVYVHLGASQRTISEAMDTLVTRWKKQRGIPEKRLHTDKLEGELSVWDLREGWTGRGYNIEKEQSFGSVAKALGLPKSTVVNRYKSAFKRITGHDFAFECWVQLLAELKVSKSSEALPRTHRQRWNNLVRATSAAPVPESAVSSSMEHSGNGVVAAQSAINDPMQQTDLLLDVCDLMAQGHDDLTIAKKLECDLEVVAYLRGQQTEFRAGGPG